MEYNSVKTDNDFTYFVEDTVNSKKTKWNPLSKQMVIGSSIWIYFFMTGLCLGAPTVFIPQIRKEANSTDAVTMEMASWLSSVTSYGGIPGVLILTVLAFYIGRRPTSIFLSFSSILGFIIFYSSNTIIQLLASQIIHGLLTGSTVSLAILVMTEYTSPRYRGSLMGFKPVSYLLGICTSNFTGTFFHWKNIGLIGLLCSIYCMLIVIFIWPESPYWLSLKGRFEECAIVHRWLRGTNAKSEKELSNLLKLGRQCAKKSKKSMRHQVNIFFKTTLLKEVYKPVLLTIMLTALIFLSGKFVFTVYSLEILKKITNSEATAYAGMLILGGVSTTSMITACIIIKLFKRRTFLLVTTFIGTTFLYTISLYLYLIKLSIIVENKFLSLILLSGYLLAVSSGPTLISSVMIGELIPLKCRGFCMCITATCSKLILATILKISPYLFQNFQFHGTFLFFAISCSIFLVLAYKYLIETNNKTLIEISECFTQDISETADEAKECLSVKNGTSSG